MAYNLDNFVGLVSTSDRVLKIYDSNNRIVFNQIGFFHPNKLWKVFYLSDRIRKKAYSMFDHMRPQVKSFNLSKKN